jgi:hypothetical protein
MITFIFNYIYSVIRRTKGFGSDSQYLKVFFVVVFSYALSTVMGLMLLEPLFFKFGNDGYRIFVILVGSFLLVYPFFRILIPGYTYLESVQAYSLVKAVIISVIIGLFPIGVVLMVLKFLEM